MNGDCADANSLAASAVVTRRSLCGQPSRTSLPRRSSWPTSACIAPMAPLMKPVPLNTANVNELTKVPGLTQTQAKAIVSYRDQHLRFTSMEELLIIEGISRHLLQWLNPYLMLDSVKDGNDNVLDRLSQKFSNSQLQLLYDLGTNTDFVYWYNELNHPEQVPTSPAGGGLRVACWNLDCLTTDKVKNRGVCEVFCLTVINHRLDLIAVQELTNPDALRLLVAELNSPTLPAIVRCSVESRGEWRYWVSASAIGRTFAGKEFGAFLWRHHLGENLQLDLVSADASDKKGFTRKPCLGQFKVSRNGKTIWDFLLISVHLKTSKPADEVRQLLSVADAPDLKVEKRLILGDFNLSSSNSAYQDLRKKGWSPLLREIPTNSSKTQSLDNIWVNPAARTLVHPKNQGVIRHGLSHLFILVVDIGRHSRISNHCPVWCQLQCPCPTNSENEPQVASRHHEKDKPGHPAVKKETVNV